MKSRLSLPILLVLVISIPVAALVQSKWEKTGDSNGILTFQKNDGGELLQVKGVIIINRGIDTMGNMLRDIQNHVKWVNYCSEARVLKIIDRNHYIFYETMSPPWPVNKRDMVLQSRSSYHNDKLMVTIESKAIPYKEFPVPEDTVRIKVLNVKMELEYVSRNKTGLIYEIKVDPSGDIPSFISNIFNQMYVYQNLDNLRLTSEDDNYISTLTDDTDKKLVETLVSKDSVLKKTFKDRLERINLSRTNLDYIVNDQEILKYWVENQDGFAEGLFWAAHDEQRKDEIFKKLMIFYLKRYELSNDEITFLASVPKVKSVFQNDNLQKHLNLEFLKNILTGKS